MGFIQDLTNGAASLIELKMSHNANLLLLAHISFTFDPLMKGSGITLSNNNLTAAKMPETDYQTVLGNILINSGQHYWEVKVDNFADEEDLFIGIARKNINLYTRPTDTNLFWGYMCLCAKTCGSDGVLTDYGSQAKKGDVIGVLLEYKSGVANLSFYRNGTKLGAAFSGLTGSFHPAVCMNYGDVQVTLDPKAMMPIS